jgi:DNA-binding transcriptional MerR regulator/catechol 2,3-dioxygenase-like lactoylglutathione lyase family enzyme
MNEHEDRLRIGQFAELVGLSVPQLRRYDRLRLLEPATRDAASGYRYYSSGQSGAARVIALLRSVDMPIAEIRRILAGAGEEERRRILRDHRARLEVRLEEVRDLLQAVDAMTEEEAPIHMGNGTWISSWLHVMPRLPVTDMERSIAYYEEALGLRPAWRTADGDLAAMASGEIETLLLVSWAGDSPPPTVSAYVYVEDPDALCAEYQQAGADIVDPVATRPSGMRDFVVQDPDGHRFTLGRGDETLRDVADRYGMSSEEIAVDPEWLERRKGGGALQPPEHSGDLDG